MASPPEVPEHDESSPGPNENLESLGSFPPEIQKQLEKLREREQPVTILVIGPTGAGKSSLINKLLRDSVAEVGHTAVGVTKEVKEYSGFYMDVSIKVYDTVGFCNAGGKSDRDIMSEIKSKNEKFDLVIICLKLEEKINEVTKNFSAALRCHLNGEMWKRSVVVLTQADLYLQLESIPIDDGGKAEAIKAKVKEFRKFFIPSDVNCQSIPFCIVGKLQQRKLPTTEDWFLDLWESCIARCSEETKVFLGIIAFMMHQLKKLFEAICDIFLKKKHDKF